MGHESRLVRGLARREPACWAAMYDQHVRTTFGVIFHLVGRDQTVAEDVNQEVWLLAIEQVDRFDPARGEFRDWIVGIARHRALRRRREHARSFENSRDVVSLAVSAQETLEGAERADAVRAALLTLHDDRRQVLLDKYAEGFSVAEIAQRTGKTAKAVESLLSRAREQMRSLLQPYFSSAPGGDSRVSNDPQPAR